METGGENARGMHAIRVLKDKKDFTSRLAPERRLRQLSPGFRRTAAAARLQAYDKTPVSSPAKAKLAEQIDSLGKWDKRWAVTSVPTTLAVFWGEEISRRVGRRRVRRA